MEIEWILVDNRLRMESPQGLVIPSDRLQSCKSRSEVSELIHECVEEAFEEFKRGWRFEPGLIDKAWESVKESDRP